MQRLLCTSAKCVATITQYQHNNEGSVVSGFYGSSLGLIFTIHNYAIQFQHQPYSYVTFDLGTASTSLLYGRLLWFNFFFKSLYDITNIIIYAFLNQLDHFSSFTRALRLKLLSSWGHLRLQQVYMLNIVSITHNLLLVLLSYLY